MFPLTGYSASGLDEIRDIVLQVVAVAGAVSKVAAVAVVVPMVVAGTNSVVVGSSS